MIEHSEEKQGKKPKTILVVDDDRNICKMIEINLRKLDYVVVPVMSGEKALTEFGKVKPDLVLLDIQMPGIDGIETLRRLRAENSSTPVIMISAHGTIEKMLQSLKLGANDFLTVPFASDRLLLSVEQSLRRSSLEAEVHRLEEFASILVEENKLLKERIQSFSENKKNGAAVQNADKYKPICGAVAHSLKGEFLIMGNSIKNLRELAGSSSDIQEECDMMIRSVEYGQILLRRLLDYLDTGKPREELIDSLELLRRAELLARPRLASNIQFEIVIDPNVKERIISANFEQLIGILLELIQNAANVLREQGGIIKLMLEGKNGNVAISVKDNGPGIPMELRKKLLKKHVSSKSGLGIGLFLCNKVVTALGGKLNMQTSSEGGTTFTILLPIVGDKKEP